MNTLDSFLAWMSAGLGGLLLAVITVLLASAEIGFRCGRRWGSSAADAESSQIGSIQGAVLGMLGLLLAFTFSMAAERSYVTLENANAADWSFAAETAKAQGWERNLEIHPPKRN